MDSQGSGRCKGRSMQGLYPKYTILRGLPTAPSPSGSARCQTPFWKATIVPTGARISTWSGEYLHARIPIVTRQAVEQRESGLKIRKEIGTRCVAGASHCVGSVPWSPSVSTSGFCRCWVVPTGSKRSDDCAPEQRMLR